MNEEVPDEVRVIYTNHGDDEWRRIFAGGADANVPTDVYRAECGCCFNTYEEIKVEAEVQNSKITWRPEGRR